jgi:hypothetical protein
MREVSSELLGRACHVFMKLAYPDGPESIPAKKQLYYQLPADRPVAEFLPPAPAAQEICQAICGPGDGVRGWAFRLGSANFPHLKLKLQLIDYNNDTTWVFMVDTHDAFSRESPQPPASHPDAQAWQALQAANRDLKEKIENALEKEGLVTFKSLLRTDLNKPVC